MACVRLTKLSDRDLLAYLAGDVNDAISAHLAVCKECQQRAATLAAQERHLTVTLYRRECPDPLRLSEYQLGLLPTTESRIIASHLRRCLHCAHELQMLTDYLTEVAPTIEVEPTLGLLDRVRILVARLVPDLPTFDAMGGLSTGHPLAAAGVRGDEAGAHLVYAVEDVQIIIDVQPDVEQPTQRVLLGLLLGLDNPQSITAQLWHTADGEANLRPTLVADRPAAQLPAPPPAQLDRRAKPVATTTVDELGNFILAALPPGAYDLILSSDKTEVHIQTLQIA